MNLDSQDITVVNPVDGAIKEIVSGIMQEQDPKKTKDLVDLFNWNISKKNVARIEKLNNLYDAITDQMTERVTKRADQFSNGDLLDYVKTIQSAIDTNTKNLSQVDEPPLILQQHNTQINVNLADTFSREAKERILAAVQATLKEAATPVEATAINIDDSAVLAEEEGTL